MYSINYDSSKNRINVVVEGNMTLEDADSYVNDFKKAVDKANPNFNICTDLSKAAVVTAEVNEKLNGTKAYAMAKGFNKNAFIVSSVVFKMQIKRVFAEGNECFFDNTADAERFLNS